ncbi:MAG: hypothetical protein KBT34_05535 [Prevotella sp.]|nr:hypothetical protein [Candidatus Prevotella equi]
MNTVLSTLLILALIIAVFFDYIRIVQYIKSRKLIEESNKWAEVKHNELVCKLTQLQTNIDLIYAMEKDHRLYKDIMLKSTTDIQKSILDIVSAQYKQYKQIKDVQDTLHGKEDKES